MPQTAPASEAGSAVSIKEKKSKEPKNTKLTQQELPACKPVLEPAWVVFIFLAISIVMIPIGAVCLSYGLQAVEVVHRYDEDCQASYEAGQSDATNDTLTRCQFTITIPEDMSRPIFVYYELNGFYQNHRRYVKSRNDLQLNGQEVDEGSLSACKPQLFLNSATNSSSTEIINPCGLIAWSNFNDTYGLETLDPKTQVPTGGFLDVTSEGIAYPSDITDRYGNYLASNFNPTQGSPTRGGNNFTEVNPDGSLKFGSILSVNMDERFVVWMRVAATPHFRKLYGILNQGLKAADQIQVTVYNRYNSYSFNGQKSIVLGTTTWLGGRSSFLGIVYVVTGCFSFVLGLVYLVLLLFVRPRKYGDISQLSSSVAVAARR